MTSTFVGVTLWRLRRTILIWVMSIFLPQAPFIPFLPHVPGQFKAALVFSLISH